VAAVLRCALSGSPAVEAVAAWLREEGLGAAGEVLPSDALGFKRDPMR
jgi:hypothetical protein